MLVLQRCMRLSLFLTLAFLVSALADVTSAASSTSAQTMQTSDDAFFTSTLAYLMDSGRGLWHDFSTYLSQTSSSLPEEAENLTSILPIDGFRGHGAKTTKFPDSPNGATLVQYAPCSPRTNATVPMMVNALWQGAPTADVTTAFISQHGANSDFDKYFSHLYPFIGENAVLVAPGFYHTNARQAPKSWYQPTRNMAWASGIDSWPVGDDAVRPSQGTYRAKPGSNLEGCSSYDTFDALLARFADKNVYPRMANVYIVGHSGGANMVSRYAQLSNSFEAYPHLHVRAVVMNAANQAYFDDARPWLATDTCSRAFSWPYQLTNVDGKMTRYVQARFDGVVVGESKASSSESDKINAVLARWSKRDVVQLVGDVDTATTGTQSCMSVSQGGPARRDRGYAFWAYQNILVNTPTDVRRYFGYGNLTQNVAGRLRVQAKLTNASTFVHQMCVVDGVGHDPSGILRSDCGHAALAGQDLPKGAGPSYPEQEQDSLAQALLDGLFK